MRRRRKLLSIVCTLTVLGLTTAFAYLCRPYPMGPGITWANAERIQPGMARTEVEQLLGYRSQVEYPDARGPAREKPVPNCVVVEMWSGRDLDVWVYFDADGIVLDREFYTGVGKPARDPNWWERMLRRLK